MKRVFVVLALSVVVGACSTGKERAPADEDAPDAGGPVLFQPLPADPAPSATPDVVPASQTVAVRLQGVHRSGQVRVKVTDVEVAADGHAVTGTLNTDELDLGVDRAWRLLTFQLPGDARVVAVKLRFQEIGTVVRAGETEVLDLRGPAISFAADAARMRVGSRVVAELDLAQSLTAQGGQLFLIPEFAVSY